MKNKLDILEAISLDFQQFINIDIDGICHCNEYCKEEGVCRGFNITGIDIKNISFTDIAKFIWSNSHNIGSKQYNRTQKLLSLFEGYDSQLDIYCIERLLAIHKLYDSSNWTFSYLNGYYGHEIDKLVINQNIQDEIKSEVEKLLSFNTFKEKVNYILTLEYGFVSDQLKDCAYKFETIERSKLYFPQTKHYKKVSKKTYYKKRDPDSIFGICLKQGEKYRVIDGYNRLSQTTKDRIKIICAYQL